MEMIDYDNLHQHDWSQFKCIEVKAGKHTFWDRKIPWDVIQSRNDFAIMTYENKDCYLNLRVDLDWNDADDPRKEIWKFVKDFPFADPSKLNDIFSASGFLKSLISSYIYKYERERYLFMCNGSLKDSNKYQIISIRDSKINNNTSMKEKLFRCYFQNIDYLNNPLFFLRFEAHEFFYEEYDEEYSNMFPLEEYNEILEEKMCSEIEKLEEETILKLYKILQEKLNKMKSCDFSPLIQNRKFYDNHAF